MKGKIILAVAVLLAFGLRRRGTVSPSQLAQTGIDALEGNATTPPGAGSPGQFF